MVLIKAQKPIRKGNTETIKLRNGERAITRRYDKNKQEWKFTKTGKEFYKTLTRHYVVSIPVKLKGQRKDGTNYTQEGMHIPITKLGVNEPSIALDESTPRRRAKIKQMVLDSLPPARGGSLIVMEHSEQSWEYDDEGEWLISEETVGTVGNDAEVSVVVNRPLGTSPIHTDTFLLSKHILPLAYENHNDKLCVPRQLAYILSKSINEIINDLNKLGGDQVVGYCPATIVEYCRKELVRCVSVHNNEVLDRIEGDLDSPIVAFLIHGDHAYFYNQKGARVLHRRFKLVAGETTDRLKHHKESKQPPPSVWLKWEGEPKEGHFGVDEEDIQQIRQHLIACGKLPRVILKDQCSIKSLSLPCDKGTCFIHVYPTDWFYIETWMKHLPCLIPYSGESLPCISLKVLIALIKYYNERVFLTGEQRYELLEQHEFCCAHCGTKGHLEFDHVARLSDNAGTQTFQPLCKDCHATKTEQEPSLKLNPLLSCFNPESWDQYIANKRLPPLIYKNSHQDPHPDNHIVDIIRCRKRAL